METAETEIAYILQQMPASSRVWVYKANRFMNAAETALAMQKARAFTAQWAAHGKALTATAFVQDNLWLVFVVDESKEGASGCSIDKVFRLVQELEQQLGLLFTDRLLLAWDNNGHTELTPLAAIQEAGITADTLIYDDTVQTLGHWNTRVKKAGESWLQRFL